MDRDRMRWNRVLGMGFVGFVLATVANADFYVWSDTCTSDSWYACCETAGDFHNNWWGVPYESCPPSSQYPEDVDDVDILTNAVYLDNAARVYNFNSDGAFHLLPAPAQLEVHDLATLAGTFEWDGGALAGWGLSSVYRLETVATLDTSSIKNLAVADFEIAAGAIASVVGDGTILLADAQLHTLPSGTDPGEFNVSTDVIIGQNPFTGGGSFLNEGLFNKTGGLGTTAVDVVFDSPGRVEVHAGTLSLSGAGVGRGPFDLDGGTVLETALYTLGAGALFPGTGLVRVPAGGNLELAAGATVTIPDLELLGNTAGEGHMHVSGTLDWTGGTMMSSGAGAPSVTIDAGCVASVSGSGGKTAAFGTFYNAGTMQFAGDGILYFGVTEFRTLAGGTFDIQTDADIGAICCAGSGEFLNDGLWVKSAGSGETTVGHHMTNTGTIEVQAGKLTFQSGDYHQTAGRTRLNGGDFEVHYHVYLNGGVLDGNGSVFAYYVHNAAGDVRPGLSAGLLNIAPPPFLSGNYSQEAGGTLSVEIGGLAPVTGYDRLAVDNVAFLDGTLAISRIGGFEPDIGDEFVVLTAATRIGTFATVAGAPISANKAFSVIYNATNVTLRVIDTCGFAPCDVNCDGSVNPFDISPFLGALGSSPPAPCSPCAADANGDGTVNPFDIEDFLVCLSS